MIWHSASVVDVLAELKVNSETGLLNGVADERLTNYGKNVITNIEKPTLFKRFFNQLQSKTLIALIIICLLSYFVSFCFGSSIILLL